jgi:hypothetical protein
MTGSVFFGVVADRDTVPDLDMRLNATVCN